MPIMKVQTDVMGPGKPTQQCPPTEQIQRQQFLGDTNEYKVDGPDTDVEDSVCLYNQATALLQHKQYRAAVKEFSAALFFVPDDENLRLLLHIGYTHALNGSKQHKSAVNDALLSLKMQSDSPKAYSVLAQSYIIPMDVYRKVQQITSNKESRKATGSI
eukprot:7564790-Ditylum_brightwellii.AAC.1